MTKVIEINLMAFQVFTLPPLTPISSSNIDQLAALHLKLPSRSRYNAEKLRSRGETRVSGN